MKVFISWSGKKSHNVALIFRDWLPSVIQSIQPYVSSEDIDKGARWSADIAKELDSSMFGILCVTKENFEAPWLLFEAGALSKTINKSFVSPFLFDIKSSEIDGPILQFQSTIFEKEDLRKLLNTLNKACGDTAIAPVMLEKAFDKWYPNLEEDLNKIKSEEDDSEDGTKKVEKRIHTSEMLEEILDLSRDNQKLLRSPDSKQINFDELKNIIQEQLFRVERNYEMDARRMSRKFNPMFLDEIMHSSIRGEKNPYGFLIALSFFKADFPWIYDVGKETFNVIKSKASKDIKVEAVSYFKEMLEFTLHHPIMRDIYGNKKDFIFFKEMPFFLSNYLDELI
ncbi:TIR domain-containing protein [Mucilaginibacter mallensis]|uniref:TIR domain-containing protein n=1 Tax=Mucilaginibacter mallensis TaxID=652787 RepID=A0A1H1NJX0_MUCMA|nr:TIR domain-containing protein [Mucilaginibacter mallensis]SDR99292.1 TIR domain-containing protein [Mucilaginibacter mallensis]